MAIISEQTYTGNGSQREFQVVGTILSDSHIGVWLVDGAVETRLATADYDVLGSVVLLNTAPAVGVSVRLLLSDSGEDLDVPPSAISDVYGNMAAILAVNANEANITTTATDIANVNTTAGSIANINLVADQIVPNLAEILLADDNATSAAASAASAAASLDSFDDRYLGAKAVAPTLDNDGNALIDGALYWDSATKQMMAWDLGTLAWLPALTLSANSTATLMNKTVDDITNMVGANHIHHECRNVSGSTIPKGTVVTAQGAQSGTDYVEIVPVTDPQTQIALGITHTAINNNGTGLVMNTGVCRDVANTSAWTVGTILYPNTTGGLTSTKPTTGQYQACAVVLRQHGTQGTLLIEFTEPKVYGSASQSGYVIVDATPTDGSSNAVSSNGVFDALALKADTSSLTNYLAKSGGTMTGAITALRETKVAMGANDIDLSAGNLFTKTISGATTLTVSNWLASGNANSFILELTNGGSAVITYPSGSKFAGGTAFTLTASGKDILGCYSHDGGTTLNWILLAKDVK